MHGSFILGSRRIQRYPICGPSLAKSIFSSFPSSNVIQMCYENFHAPCGKVSTFFFLLQQKYFPCLHKLKHKTRRLPFLLDLAVGLSGYTGKYEYHWNAHVKTYPVVPFPTLQLPWSSYNTSRRKNVSLLFFRIYGQMGSGKQEIWVLLESL